jgi:hypothetical protein
MLCLNQMIPARRRCTWDDCLFSRQGRRQARAAWGAWRNRWTLTASLSLQCSGVSFGDLNLIMIEERARGMVKGDDRKLIVHLRLHNILFRLRELRLGLQNQKDQSETEDLAERVAQSAVGNEHRRARGTELVPAQAAAAVLRGEFQVRQKPVPRHANVQLAAFQLLCERRKIRAAGMCVPDRRVGIHQCRLRGFGGLRQPQVEGSVGRIEVRPQGHPQLVFILLDGVLGSNYRQLEGRLYEMVMTAPMYTPAESFLQNRPSFCTSDKDEGGVKWPAHQLPSSVPGSRKP